MILGNVQLNGLAILAPLAGVTDSTFRLICKQHGAALAFSEMVSADGLVHDDVTTKHYTFFRNEERPIGIQIFGSDPWMMADAAQRIEVIAPDFIDLNFGCPVKKVVKRGAGAAILKNLALMKKIASAVVNSTSLPILAKIRSGWDQSQINAVEAAQILEDCGISAITIHPRTQTQLFKGQANWEIIKQVKESVSIPVIGNGDIKNPIDAKTMIAETNCDLIMIGRAALGNPWIFSQINHFIETNSLDESPISYDLILHTCLKHLELTIKAKGEYRGLMEMRKHLAWYLKGLPFSSMLRATLFKLTKMKDVKEQLYLYFDRIKEAPHV